MHRSQDGTIVETAADARQAEPGPSIFRVLTTSVALAVVVLGAVYLLFFTT